MGYHIFDVGPQGREIYVDENNRLILNAAPSASGYIFQYGPKGRPLLVDASGRLLVNVSGIESSAGTLIHNNLTGMQGGASGEYYHLSEAQYNAASGIGYGVVIPSGGGWVWSSGVSLYYADLTHNLNNRYVLVQCHDPVTYDSVSPDHWTLTDEDHTRIWASTDDALGVTIRLSSTNSAPSPSIYDLGVISSGTTTIDWLNGYTQKMALSGSPTLAFSNGVIGGVYMLAFTQDASGSRVATWPGDVRWPSDVPLALTTTANRTDYFGFIYDGTYYNGTAVATNLYN
jgi:hypothetical protein